MSKLWGKTFQEAMSKTISDSTARLKQGWTERPQNSPEPSSQSSSPRQAPLHPSPGGGKDKQQYLRLPVESARKLRWYDREDLTGLVELNTREKKALQATIAALRQVIQDSGRTEDELDEEVRERVAEAEHQEASDEGVASVLLAALQTESSALAARLAERDHEVEDLKHRLSKQREAFQSALVGSGEQPVVLRISVAGASAATADDLHLPHTRQEGASQMEDRGDGGGANCMAPGSNGAGSRDDHELAPALLDKLRRVEEERRDYFEEVARLNDLLRSHESSARLSLDQIAQLEGDLEKARSALAEAQDQGNTKIQELKARVDASQAQHKEMLRRAQEIVTEAEERASNLEGRAERAEARAQKAESQLKDANAEVRRVSAEFKTKEKEANRLEGRAATAEGLLAEAKQKGDVEKGGALTAALAAARKASDEREGELRRAMREGEAKLRERIERLENDNANLRRAVAKAEAGLHAAEARIAEAEEAEAHLQRELRIAEMAVLDREEVERHNKALLERLEESRSEHGQLANYKQIAKQLEEARARVEEEVVATVRIASALETRLQAAHKSVATAEQNAAAAERRAVEAEARVEMEVARRLEVMNGDEAKWPSAARDSIARQAKKVEALHGVLNGLQGELEQEQHNLAAEQGARKTLQGKLAASEEKLERSQREARETIHRLEQKVGSLQQELKEWQQEVSSAESEIGRLMSMQRKAQRPAFQRTFSTSSHSSTPRNRGGGSLHFNDMVVANGKEAAGATPVDVVYLKNVLLKFIVAASQGKIEQCQVLLPPVATLLHASPQEFSSLKAAVQNLTTWWPQTS